MMLRHAPDHLDIPLRVSPLLLAALLSLVVPEVDAGGDGDPDDGDGGDDADDDAHGAVVVAGLVGRDVVVLAWVDGAGGEGGVEGGDADDGGHGSCGVVNGMDLLDLNKSLL